MAALAAIRADPVLRTLYHRVLQAGKLTKGAIAAQMRKLMTIVNAILCHQTRWRPASAS
jgi:transposase